MDEKKVKGVAAIIGVAAVLGSVLVEHVAQTGRQESEIKRLKSQVDKLKIKNFMLETEMINREITFANIISNHAKRGCPMTEVDRKFLANAQTLIR